MLLKDKVVIISGVGPGMGQSMAKLAAREGAKVGMGARNQEFLDSVAAEIKDNGGEVVAISTDISQESQCQNLVDKVVEAFGRVDGLVNSAYLHGEWATTDVADTSSWSDLYEVNCLGALRMAQACLLNEGTRWWGDCECFNNGNGQSFPGEAAYAASKGQCSR